VLTGCVSAIVCDLENVVSIKVRKRSENSDIHIQVVGEPVSDKLVPRVIVVELVSELIDLSGVLVDSLLVHEPTSLVQIWDTEVVWQLYSHSVEDAEKTSLVLRV